MGYTVSCWWESVAQATAVELEGEVAVSWVGSMGVRVRNSDMKILGEILSVEGYAVRRLVGALDVSR